MLNDVKSNVSILKISFVFVQYNLLLYLTTKSTEKATHCLLLEKKLFLLKEREKKRKCEAPIRGKPPEEWGPFPETISLFPRRRLYKLYSTYPSLSCY